MEELVLIGYIDKVQQKFLEIEGQCTIFSNLGSGRHPIFIIKQSCKLPVIEDGEKYDLE